MERIRPDDTPFSLAQRILGDGRLVHDLQIPHWDGKGPLPVDSYAYLINEAPGPPARNWTKPRSTGGRPA